MAHSVFALTATQSRLWPILYGRFPAAKLLDTPHVFPRRQVGLRVYRMYRTNAVPIALGPFERAHTPACAVCACTAQMVEVLVLRKFCLKFALSLALVSPPSATSLPHSRPTPSRFPHGIAAAFFCFGLQRARLKLYPLDSYPPARPPAPLRRTSGSRPSARLRPSVCRS
jgi:hypothetical protein